jgi:histidine ammonia-lyase
MITQYAAASMVSENKIYAHPACVDSIPSSGNQEDHVSMGTTAARTAALILDNSQKVLGIELFAASQAIWLRGEAKGEEASKSLAPATKAAYDFIRRTVAPIDKDIVMHDELVKFDEMIKNNSIVEEVLKVVEIC